MRVSTLLPFVAVGAAAAAVADPAFAGDPLGISDAGSMFAEGLAQLGIVLAIAGLAVGGLLMMTNVFLALTVGGSLLIGGSVMALSEDVGSTLWGASLGGGDPSGYVPDRARG